MPDTLEDIYYCGRKRCPGYDLNDVIRLKARKGEAMTREQAIAFVHPILIENWERSNKRRQECPFLNQEAKELGMTVDQYLDYLNQNPEPDDLDYPSP